MGTFRYNAMTSMGETVTFAGKKYPMKYLLRQNNEVMATGYTDLRSSHGSLIDTDGCLVLFVNAGCAIATINCKRRSLRRGDFVLLFYDSTLSIDAASVMFSIRYVSFAYTLVEEAIYKPLSDRFGDILYENPVFHVSDGQKELLDAWWRQLEWTACMNDKTRQEEILKNTIRNLFIATDTEIMRALSGNELNSERGRSWMLVTRFYYLVALHCHEIEFRGRVLYVPLFPAADGDVTG